MTPGIPTTTADRIEVICDPASIRRNPAKADGRTTGVVPPRRFAHDLPTRQEPSTTLDAPSIYSPLGSSSGSCAKSIEADRRAFIGDQQPPKKTGNLLARITNKTAELVYGTPPRQELSPLKQDLSRIQRLELLKHVLGGKLRQEPKLRAVVDSLNANAAQRGTDSTEFSIQLELELIRQISLEIPGFSQYAADVFCQFRNELEAARERTAPEDFPAVREKLRMQLNQALIKLIDDGGLTDLWETHLQESRENWLAGSDIDSKNVGPFPPPRPLLPGSMSRARPKHSDTPKLDAYGNTLSMHTFATIANACHENDAVRRNAAVNAIRAFNPSSPADHVLDTAGAYLRSRKLMTTFKFQNLNLASLQTPGLPILNGFHPGINTGGTTDLRARDEWERRALDTQAATEKIPYGDIADYTKPDGSLNPIFSSASKHSYAILRTCMEDSYPAYGNSFLIYKPSVNARALFYAQHISTRKPEQMCDQRHIEHLAASDPHVANMMKNIGQQKLLAPNNGVFAGKSPPAARISAAIFGALTMQDIQAIHIDMRELESLCKTSAEKWELLATIHTVNTAHMESRGHQFIYLM